MHPVEVHLHADDHRLDIRWDDGHLSSYDLAYLRGYCPCAKCQGHFAGTVRYVSGANATLVDVQPVGSYALRPLWGDGHSTGIYAFDYLRRIEHTPPGDGPSNRCASASTETAPT